MSEKSEKYRVERSAFVGVFKNVMWGLAAAFIDSVLFGTQPTSAVFYGMFGFCALYDHVVMQYRLMQKLEKVQSAMEASAETKQS